VTNLFAPTGARIALRRLAGVRFSSRCLLKNGICALSEVPLLMLPGHVRFSFRLWHEELSHEPTNYARPGGFGRNVNDPE